MTEWREMALGDVCELKRGYDLPRRAREDGSVPIVSSSGVTGYHSTAKIEAPGVVTGRYGTLGEVFYLEDDFWPLNTALYVRDFKGNDPEFVAALLTSMDLAQHDGAAAVPGLNRNQLHKLPVSVPSPDVQHRVARTLRCLDDLIENNRRRVEVLEAMARAIYREWFVHFRFPGHEDTTFADSDLGPVPEGWDVLPLGSIAAAERTTVHPKDEPETWFDHCSIPAFDDGQLPAPEIGESIRSGKYAVMGPAVMVSKLNPRIPRTWFIEPAGPNPCVASTEFVILRPQGQRSLEWIFGTVTSSTFEDRLKQLSGGTSGSHQRLRPAEMLAIEVIDPPPELVDRATDMLGPILTMSRRLRENSKQLAATRDLLLPKLVTGKIDVSDLDLDAVVEKAAV